MITSRILPSLYAGLLTAISHSPTHAETPNQPLTAADLLDLPIEELVKVKVVSEATGSKQPISKAPAIVEIITAEDIKKMGATDLDEVLETVPELHVGKRPFCYNPLYIMRGMLARNNAEVLWLVNDIPVNLVQNGDKTSVWGGMPVNAIARIEVIRGTGAAIHGDAFMGAINIVTKNQADIQGTETGMRLGSFQTKEAWLLHGGKYHGIDVAATLEYSDSEGYREQIETDRQTALDKRFGTQVSYAPGPVNVPRESYDARLELSQGAWRWRTGLQQRDDVGTGAGAALALSPQSRYEAQRFNTDLTYQQPQWAEFWEVTARLSYLDNQWASKGDNQLLPPGTMGGAFPRGQLTQGGAAERQTWLNLSAFYSGFSSHLLRVTTGYSIADVYEVVNRVNYDPKTNRPLGPMTDISDTPEAFLPELTRQSYYLLVQDAWQLAHDWELTLGTRYYHYSDFGDTNNPHVGLVWQARPNLVFKGLYGQAFRAPVYNELYISGPSIIGNPNLSPERSRTIELAASYSPTKRLQFEADVFSYRVADTMVSLPSLLDPSKKQLQNAGSRQGYGMGLDIQWRWSQHLQFHGNYSFQRVTEQDQSLVPNTPHQEFYFRTDWKFGADWYLDGQVNWIGKRYRAMGDTRPPVAGYLTTDLTLRYHSEKQPWEVGLSVRNLFDADVREPADSAIPNDLPLAGRSVWGEVRYRF